MSDESLIWAPCEISIPAPAAVFVIIHYKYTCLSLFRFINVHRKFRLQALLFSDLTKKINFLRYLIKINVFALKYFNLLSFSCEQNSELFHTFTAVCVSSISLRQATLHSLLNKFASSIFGKILFDFRTHPANTALV